MSENFSYFKTLSDANGYKIYNSPWVGYVEETNQLIWNNKRNQIIVVGEDKSISYVDFETSTIELATTNNINDIACRLGKSVIDIQNGDNKNSYIILYFNPITEIDSDTFSSDDNITNIKLPSTLKILKENAFRYQPNLTVSCESNVLETIGSVPFYNATIENFVIPNTLKSFGSEIFCDSYIKNLYIYSDLITPDNVQLFLQSLKHIDNVYCENNSLDSRNHCGGIIDTANNKLLYASNSIIMDPTITSIGYGAFIYAGEIIDRDTLEIPSTITTFSEYSFNGCDVENLIFNSNLTKIPVSLFNTCKARNIIINQNITTICENSFAGTTKLKTITFPNTGITMTGSYLFENSGLTNLDLLKYFRNIGNRCFSGCDNLQSYVIIPNNINDIGYFPFPSTVTSLTLNCEANINNEYSGAETEEEAAGCGWSFFHDAFIDVHLIGCTSIPYKCFNFEKSLELVEFGENVKSIDSEAFWGCTAIKTLIFNNSTPITLSMDQFSTVETIYVPDSAVDAYKAHTSFASCIDKIKPLSEK